MKQGFCKRTAAVLLTILLLLAFTGCSSGDPGENKPGTGSFGEPQSTPGSTAPPPEASSSSQPDPQPEKADGQDPSYWIMQGKIEGAKSLFGMAYIGFSDGPMGDGYTGFAEENGYLEEYPFLQDIAPEQIVEAGGYEIYAIVPPAGCRSLTVSEWLMSENGESFFEGEVLYHSEQDKPIYLQCNYSDIMSNVKITLVTEDGTEYSFSPFMSLMDGKLEEGRSGKAYDFTLYKEFGGESVDSDPADLFSMQEIVWICENVSFAEREDLLLGMNLYKGPNGEDRVEYWYGYPDADTLESFEGAIYSPDIGDEPGVYMLDMEAVGGLLYEPGNQYFFTGKYRFEWAPEYDGSILVTHMDGTPMLFGHEGVTFRFYGYYG